MLKFCLQVEQLSEYLLVNNSQNHFSHYTQSIDHMKLLICANLKVIYVSVLAKSCLKHLNSQCSAKYCFSSISVTSVRIWFLALEVLLHPLMLA